VADIAQFQATRRDALAEAKPAAVRSWNPSDGRLAFLLTLPTMALLLFVGVFPLIWSLGLSFTRYDFTTSAAPVFVGGLNYARVLANEDIWSAFVTTAKYVVMAVGTEFVLGFGIALLLNRSFPGRGLLTTLMLLPMMLSPVIAASFWKQMYEPQWGALNYYIKLLGFPPVEWLANQKISLVSLAIVDVWQWTPFMLLISLAGLSAVPRYLYEAAEVDQASGWFKFRYITLPLVWPLLLIALIFRTMDAVRVFEYPRIMTADSDATQTITTRLYHFAFPEHNTGLSSAFAYIILVMIIALTTVYIRYLTRATSRQDVIDV
jgi:multiple sugar transport system permease protein